MKGLKITFGIIFTLTILACLAPIIYVLIDALDALKALGFDGIFQTYLKCFENIGASFESGELGMYVILVAPMFGVLLLLLWIIFAVARRRYIGILLGFVALVLGVLVSVETLLLGIGGTEGLYQIMGYVAIGGLGLLLVSFILHVVMMFKHQTRREKVVKEVREEVFSSYGLDYNDLPPVLSEEQTPDKKPDIVTYHDDHIPVGENHVLKGHYIREEEVEAILAAGPYHEEEEIPESILAFLDSKHEAEENGISLPMFDPNFVPTEKDKDMLTEEELFVLEALRNYTPKKDEVSETVEAFLAREYEPREEEVPEGIRHFLNSEPEVPQEEPVPERVMAFLNSEPIPEEEPHLKMFDPNYVPPKKEEPAPAPLTEEELAVVEAMSHYEPEEKEPEFYGVSDEEYVNLPMFGEHEEPIEIFEEVIRIEEPKEEVRGPKLSSLKPVHISKNKEGKFQAKQVGEDSPLAVFDSEAEAVRYGEALKKANGVSVRVHDEEGKIRSL